MLENSFYKILTSADGHYTVALLPDCDVYRGHFPGEPISPGVCSIQMVKELMERQTGKHLMLTDIKQARFTTLITPVQHHTLDVNIELTPADDKYTYHATVGQGDNVFVELKGTTSTL